MEIKYTLGKNYVLRQNQKDSFMLFNTKSSLEYDISQEFYCILKMLKYNILSLDFVYEYLKNNGIDIDILKIEKIFNKIEFSDLLEESNLPNSNSKDVIIEGLPSFVNYTPQRIDLVLTEKCNLQCKHCFQESTPFNPFDFSPIEKLIAFCDEIEELNIKSLKITGGEPLVYPDIKKLLQHLVQKKYQKSILTNAILLDSDIIDIVKGHNFRFGISLDGSKSEIHEFLRGKNTFDRAVKNIMNLQKNGIYFSLNTTLHSFNYMDIEKIFDLGFRKLEAHNININIIFPLGRGSENNELCLSKEKIFYIKNKLSELRELYPEKIIRLNDAEETLSYEDNTDLIYCSGGTKTLCINPQLEVYPCSYAFGMDEFKMGVVGNERIIDIWQNSKWNIFRGETKLKDLKSCHSCAFNKKCAYRNCRIKPIYQGLDFYSSITYCKLGNSLC